jgi:hypothetical protein
MVHQTISFAYGEPRSSLFRIPYATSNKALAEAYKRIQTFCNSLR